VGDDPHTVLEGLLIAAHTVGADCCFVCINRDFREEISTLETALERWRITSVPLNWN
jgi:NADH:ubiquinone oxidoreductase subunit F (NADH-binding)